MITEEQLQELMQRDDVTVKTEPLNLRGAVLGGENPDLDVKISEGVPKRTTIGQANGQAFERLIELEAIQMVRDERLANFTRQQPPMVARYSRELGQVVFVPTAVGPCDYSFVLPDGTAGVFDAKSTKESEVFRWPVRQGHQLDEMRRLVDLTKGRSVAFALVEWRAHDEVRAHLVATISGLTVRRTDGILVRRDWIYALEESSEPRSGTPR